jgi:uncharacterized membrane protein
MKKTRIWRRRIIHFLFWFVLAILTAFLAFDMMYFFAKRTFYEDFQKPSPKPFFMTK